MSLKSKILCKQKHTSGHIILVVQYRKSKDELDNHILPIFMTVF